MGVIKPVRKRFFYGWVIVAAMSAINFGGTATGNLSFGLFVLPMGESLGMSRTQFGWVQTVRSLAAGLSSFPVGRVVDRYGPRFMVVGTAVVVGVCLFGVGRVESAWQFMALYGVIGLTGLAAPNSLWTTVPIAKWFRRLRGRALAMAFMGGAIGGIALLPITQALIDRLGWRDTWTVLSVIFLSVTIPTAAIFLRRMPQDMGLNMDGDPAPPSISRSAAATPAASEAEEGWTVRDAIRTGALWKLLVVFALSGVAMGGTMVHRIAYWVEEQGFDPQIVSFSFSADTAGAAGMALAAGFLMDRFPVRYMGAGFYLVFVVAIVLMMMGWNEFFLFASTTLNGMAIGATLVLQAYVFAAFYGSEFLGAIRGFVMPVTMVSIAIGAPLAGYLRDETGSYDTAWWLIVVLYALSALVMSTVTPPRRRVRAA